MLEIFAGVPALPQREEAGDDIGLWEVVREAVCGADGGVVGAVGLAQFVGHGEGVVEVGKIYRLDDNNRKATKKYLNVKKSLL